MRIYVKNIKKDKLYIEYGIKLSFFIPDGLEEVIEKAVPDEDFIIGVGYEKGDYQICVSGHPKIDEDEMSGTIREMQEELSLKPINLHFFKNKGKNNFFFCNINETTMSPIRKNKFTKDIDSRSVICIFGNEKDILKYLSEVFYKIESSDEIDKIWGGFKK